MSKYKRSKHLSSASPRTHVKVVMADLPRCSRCILVLRPEDEDLAAHELPGGLARILPIMESRLDGRAFLPPPRSAGRAQFGIIGVPEETDLEQERSCYSIDTLLAARWSFTFEWVRDRSAWNALLFTLDHLSFSLPLLALDPGYVLPTFFVVRMADRPRTDIVDTVSAWGPMLDTTCTLLAPVVYGLYDSWIDGPTRAASLYRQCHEIASTGSLFSRHWYDPLVQLLGKDTTQNIRCAKRPDPAAFRLLAEVGLRLWDVTVDMSEQQCELMQEHAFLQALLPLALWSPDAPACFENARALPHSLEELYTYWRDWRRRHV